MIDDRRRAYREPPPIAGRNPPMQLDAEAACLSAMLLKPSAIAVVQAYAPLVDWFSDANRSIAEACFEIADQGKPVDLITVAEWLRGHDRMAQVGGAGYLAQIVDATPAVANVATHAAFIHRDAVARRQIAAMQTATAIMYGAPHEERREHLAAVAAALDEDSDADPARERASLDVSLEEGVNELFDAQRGKAAGEVTGVSTGIRSLDVATGGLHPTDMLIVSGPTGQGKTSLAAQLVLSTTDQWTSRRNERDEEVPMQFGGAIFTLEMPRQQYAMRIACGYGGVDYQAIRTGTANAAGLTRLREAQIALRGRPVEIDHTVRITPREINRRVKRIRAEMLARGVRLRTVVIDHIGLIEPSQPKGRNETDAQVMDAMGRELRSYSQESEHETWIILSQQNAEGALSRASSLKTHAVVWLQVSVDHAGRDYDGSRMPGSIAIKKQRFGPLEKVPVWFEGRYARFTDGSV